MEIQTLLEALDDKNVRTKIREILRNENDNSEQALVNDQASSVDITELLLIKHSLQKAENENEDLKKLIDKLKSLLALERDAKEEVEVRFRQITEQNNEKSLLVAKLEADNKPLIDVQNQLRNNVDELNQKLNYYRENFHDDLQVSELYSRLSQQTRQSLSGIFKDTSVQGLMACGIQEKNISNLWDYAKSEIVNGNNDDITTVILLFNLLFKRFKLAYPMFALQGVKVGDPFDTQHHIKHRSSVNTSGPIVNILMDGYVNTKVGKIIRPSVVSL